MLMKLTKAHQQAHPLSVLLLNIVIECWPLCSRASRSQALSIGNEKTNLVQVKMAQGTRLLGVILRGDVTRSRRLFLTETFKVL